MSPRVDVSPPARPHRPPASPARFKSAYLVLAIAVLAVASGCTGVGRWYQQGFKVGPNYGQPPAPVSDNWIDYENPDVASAPTDYSRWWSVFGDPTLDQLIDTASQQSLTLQAAGMRILEARARLGIARGSQFPQIQQAYGDFARINTSGRTANTVPITDFDFWDAGFNASWELDFWGRFRRAIEAEDALLNAEIESYDNVLVVLQAEVAAAYIQYRTLQQRLDLAKKNVKIQQRTFDIADVRFRNGRVTELDPVLAKENLEATRSLIPDIESGIRQAGNAICVLLGVPPRDLTAELGDGPIPNPPAEILAGIPAELLRRRPDVRRAERLAAAQSAVIGVAESDLYPRIAITGFIGFESEDLTNLSDQASLAGSIGPGFQWNILNYGRIRNNVRANEAKFHQLVFDYQSTVLAASREVEDGIVSFLKERERAESFYESATQAQRAVDLSTTRWENGGDFLAVVYTQEILTIRQDALAASRGAVAANVVSIYKALGGGWQTRMTGAGMPSEAGPFEDEPPAEDVVPPPDVDGAPPADAGRPADPAPPEVPPVPRDEPLVL
ncbi:MAG: efflux transporter outer membrane subunit [Candidatus Nealsonbacteria bacterium]|nr:efflux transporter outer membrane subunit [Candidatus Nealsonbacteria bacterium]